MRRILSRKTATVLFAAVIACWIPVRAQAQVVKHVQIAIWNPVQIYDSEVSIHGFRLNLVYGLNREVLGVDLGVVNSTTGDFKGFGVGLAGNWVDGDMTGWQDGIANFVEGDARGVMTGIFNRAHNARGFLLGFLNNTDDMVGLQLGVFNITDNLHGIQIGLLNIIRNDGFLPVFPIVNWSF